ncbi:hypothetical protein [Streptomyces buecherae]|uniref:hypothetical protein n=1 Tax=Streptomyces buecherae TaxID=2763006 RepID=UPI003797D3CA
MSAPLSGVNESQAVRQLAANLLKYEGDRFNAQERAELQAFANGTNIGTKGKLDSLVKLLKKVKGFAKAVKGSYKSFKNWYKNLPWYVKAPLAAAGVGSHLWEIWNLFH